MIELAAGVAGALAAALLWRKWGRLWQIAPWRRDVLAAARAELDKRTLYQWGGGHVPGTWGLDCSGLVIQAYKAAGITIAWNSNSMWHLGRRITAPTPGDVALYGIKAQDRAVHVRLVTDYDPETGVASWIGSEGGDSSTITPEIARRQNAHVKSGADHRSPRFLGFVSLAEAAAGKSSGLLADARAELEPALDDVWPDALDGSDSERLA